jgi:hypothetical protein
MVYNIKRMDATGHTDIKCECASEAAIEVNQHRADGFIAYLDGQLFGGERVTESDLSGVSNIVLATPIRGG